MPPRKQTSDEDSFFELDNKSPALIRSINKDDLDYGDGAPMSQTTGCLFPTGMFCNQHLFCGDVIDPTTPHGEKNKYCKAHFKIAYGYKPRGPRRKQVKFSPRLLRRG